MSTIIKIKIRHDDHDIDFRFPISESELFAKLGKIHDVEGRDAAQSALVTEIYSWLDDISSQPLLEKLLSLSEDDLDILDAYVFGEKKYREIGEAKKVTLRAFIRKSSGSRSILQKIKESRTPP